MIGALLVTINIGFFGLLVSYFFGLKMFLEQRVAAALLIGLIVLSYVSFTIAHFWNLSQVTLALTLLVVNILSLSLLRKKTWELFLDDWHHLKERYKQRSWQVFALILTLFILLFGYLAVGMLTEEEGSLYVQPVHAYGDISLHLGIISSFVFGNNFPPQNPNFSGTPISYPFMVDYLTAFFIQPVGLSFEYAFAWSGVLLFGILITLLAFFVITLTKSKKIALLALSLFLFNGGFGFIYWYEGFISSGKNIFDFMWTLPQDYTAIKDLGYWWINVNLSMLLPQRSFLFGFGVSLLILSIFIQLKDHFQIKSYILVILLLAVLPLIHAHSLVALSVFILYFLFFIFKNQKTDRVVIFLIGLNGLLAAFLLSRQFLAQSNNLLSLFSWQIGWMSHQESLLRFYFKNFGAILVVFPLALYFIKKQTTLWHLGLISLIWFVLPSLMIFQPWDFDNIKLFIYWYFFASILAAAFLVKLFHNGLWQKGVVIGLFTLMILAGFLDIFRIVTSSGTRYPIYGVEAIKMAEFVKNNTPASSVFVSADKFDNPVVSLAGRKVVMGFSPWLWTYGIDYSQKQMLISNILNGQINKLEIDNNNISHVIFFSGITSYTQNQQYFDDNAELIYNQDGYRIYKL